MTTQGLNSGFINFLFTDEEAAAKADTTDYTGETLSDYTAEDFANVDIYDNLGLGASADEQAQEAKLLNVLAQQVYGKSYSTPTTQSTTQLTEDEKTYLRTEIDKAVVASKGLIDENAFDALKGLTKPADTAEDPSDDTPPNFEPPQATDDSWVGSDPIFTEEDGGIFEVKGEAGKTYNFISDKGFQVNTLFGSPDLNAENPQTFIQEVGVTTELAGSFAFSIDESGSILVDGNTIPPEGITRGDVTITVQNDGSVVLKRAGKYNQADSYELYFTVNSKNYFDIATKRTEQNDNTEASGLLGTTFDDDTNARNGIIPESLPEGVLVENIIIQDGKFIDSTTGEVIDDALNPTVIKFKKEGGGAIEDENGQILEDGTEIIGSYEVNDLFDTEFNSFSNVFDVSGDNDLEKFFKDLNTKSNTKLLDFSFNSNS